MSKRAHLWHPNGQTKGSDRPGPVCITMLVNAWYGHRNLAMNIILAETLSFESVLDESISW